LEVEEVVVWFQEPNRVEGGIEEGAKGQFVKRFAIVAAKLMPEPEKAMQASADISMEQDTDLAISQKSTPLVVSEI